MAQWTGQFSGLTHETKARDIEHSLRQAIKTLEAAAATEQAAKLKAIHHLAERLLAARRKVLHARIAALLGPRSKDFDEMRVSHLRIREQELQVQGVDGILKEFGLNENILAQPAPGQP